MLQAEKEKQVFEALNAYVVEQGLDFRVSVITGPSGSYKEEDILAFLDQTLLWRMVFGLMMMTVRG